MSAQRRPCASALVFCLLLATRGAHAKETVLDDFESTTAPAPWVFSNGAEFPGATGALTSGAGLTGKGAHLAYDLSGGGHYVSATLTLQTPASMVALGYSVRSAGIRAKLRVRDSSGQTLQYDASRPLEASAPGEFYRMVVDLSAASGHFGGSNDGVLHQPIVAVTLMAADPIEPGVAGAVDFDDVTYFDALAPSIDPSGTVTPAPAGADDLASRLAVNIHFTKDDRALDIAKTMGFSAVRMDLGWSGVERTKGAYDFSALDGLVASLDARSMRLHLILDYFDALYPGADSPDFAAVTVPAFAALAKACAGHFKGKKVTYEIWNEPNLDGFWPPSANAPNYAKLSAAAIAGVHQGDATALVSTAGISGFDLAFLRGYLAANGAAGADAIGVHPYRQGPPESVIEDLLWMRHVVGESLTPVPPIWDTEWGYSATWYGNGTDPATRQIQAVRAVRGVLSAWAVGFPLAVYYDLRDDGTDGTNGEHNFGLVQNDYSDKPAAVAVRTLSGVARGRTFGGFLSVVPSSLHAMRLDGRTDRVVVLWSDAPGAVVNVAVPGVTAVTDVFGAALGLANVTVREANGPVYLTYPKPTVPDAGSSGGAPSASIDAGPNAGGASASGGGTRSTASGGLGGASGAEAGGGGTSGLPDGGGASGGAPVANSSDSSGCGCRVARSDSRSAGASGLLLVLAGYGIRRARRGKRR
jgi:hypothetical protein